MRSGIACVGFPPGGGFGFGLVCGKDVAGVGCVYSCLHLTTKPHIVFGCFLLLPNEVAHEITQELRPRSIPGPGGLGKLGFQRLIDAKGEGCIGHDSGPGCYRISAA
jgi:hypothetical protein